MAYQVHKRKLKDGSSIFRIVFQKYEAGVRTAKHIPKSEWLPLGIQPTASFAEAKERCEQLNAQDKIDRIETKRNKVKERLTTEALIVSAFLPAGLVAAFEEHVMARRLARGPLPLPKHLSRWRAAQRLIRDIKMPPEEWTESPEIIYGYLERAKLSLDYTKKIIRMLNLWGHFVCRKEGRAFLPIPHPRGFDAGRIHNAYREKSPQGRESAPITPSMLTEALKRGLSQKHYNWLYISIWFGLRPSEIDSFLKPGSYKITLDDKIKVLNVFQGKLIGLAPEKRWKRIPLVEKEQHEALRLIELGEYKRPLVKTLESLVGVGCYTNGGRKGFTSLMLDRGHDFIFISNWLGHQSLDRTARQYQDRTRVMYKKVA